MKVVVDQNRCLKAGECYYNHPTVFQYTDSGFPKVVIAEVTTDEERREAEEAIEVCPGSAISFED